MKRFVLANLFFLLTAAAITPAASAKETDHSFAMDRNGDGIVSIQETRLHYLDYSSN